MSDYTCEVVRPPECGGAPKNYSSCAPDNSHGAKGSSNTETKDVNDFKDKMEGKHDGSGDVPGPTGGGNKGGASGGNGGGAVGPAGGGRRDATGGGASALSVTKDKSSWFYLDNLHGNGSLDNWKNRLAEGLFGKGNASIYGAYTKGYFNTPGAENAANKLIAEGAFTRADYNTAMANVGSGKMSEKDSYILAMTATRHAASFGGDPNSLNWEEDALGGYLNYIRGMGINPEFVHGTINNFKMTICAVQKGGDALTIEGGEWALNNHQAWSGTWGAFIH